MKLEESAASIYFIRPFFHPPEVQSPDSARLPSVKTPTKTHSARLRDSNEKVFSNRQKNKLISFSEIRSKRSSLTPWRRSHMSAVIKNVMFICGGAVMLMVIKELDRILMLRRSGLDAVE